MKDPIGFFWHAYHSQIYPQLTELEAAGLVTHEVIEQEDRPDKKLYRITHAGRETLRAWVVSPSPIPPDRDELMLKTFSLWLADPAEASAAYRRREQEHARQRATYEQIKETLERERGAELKHTDSAAFASYATLTRGIAYESGYAAWCRWMADTLERTALQPETAEPDSG